MRIRRFLGLCSILVAAAPSFAGAQDTKKVGITMGYPAAVGVLWHVSDKVAIRPEISFAGSSTTTSGSGVDISGDGWNIGTGVSVVFYLRKYDHLRTYISPRFTYGYQSSTSTTTGLPVTGVTSPTYTQSSEAFGGFGMFGAQYWLGDRFGVFGEFGFGVSHSSTKANVSPISGSGNGWGTRAGVGVVFYP